MHNFFFQRHETLEYEPSLEVAMWAALSSVIGRFHFREVKGMFKQEIKYGEDF